jgi:hypothetical protein
LHSIKLVVTVTSHKPSGSLPPGGTTDIPLPEEIKGMNAQEVVARDSLFCPASVPTIMSVIPVALKYTPCGAMALTELPKEKSSRSESLRHDLICKFAK